MCICTPGRRTPICPNCRPPSKSSVDYKADADVLVLKEIANHVEDMAKLGVKILGYTIKAQTPKGSILDLEYDRKDDKRFN